MSEFPVFEYPEWMADGACRGMDPETFFPGRGEDTRAQKAVCRACPVVDECREFGMDQRFGIWGGLTERERRRRRHIKAVAA